MPSLLACAVHKERTNGRGDGADRGYLFDAMLGDKARHRSCEQKGIEDLIPAHVIADVH